MWLRRHSNDSSIELLRRHSNGSCEDTFEDSHKDTGEDTATALAIDTSEALQRLFDRTLAIDTSTALAIDTYKDTPTALTTAKCEQGEAGFGKQAPNAFTFFLPIKKD